MISELVDKKYVSSIQTSVIHHLRDEVFGKTKDIHPGWLSFQNGMVDLRTGQLRPAVPDDNITKTLELDYDPDADYSEWEEFVRMISRTEPGAAAAKKKAAATAKAAATKAATAKGKGKGKGKATAVEKEAETTETAEKEATEDHQEKEHDESGDDHDDHDDDTIYDFIRWMIGYAVQGNPVRKLFFMLYGKHGNNGKSLFLNTLGNVMGMYSSAMKRTIVFDSHASRSAGGHDTELVQLRGKRF